MIELHAGSLTPGKLVLYPRENIKNGVGNAFVVKVNDTYFLRKAYCKDVELLIVDDENGILFFGRDFRPVTYLKCENNLLSAMVATGFIKD